MASRDDPDGRRERHLRDRAERLWQNDHDDLVAKAPEEVRHLVEDLQIHQIELQLQNQELRETQQELENSREQLRDLYDFAPVGYLTIDGNGVIVRANLTLATMLGRVRRHLIGRHFHQYVNRTSHLDLNRALGSDAASWSGELVLSKADGTLFPVAVEMARIGGDVVLWRCAVTDITTRKADEHALRETAALLDLASDAIFVRDLDGHLLYWNDGAARCYGWSSVEARGQMSQTLLQTQFPEALEHVIEIVRQTGHWAGELVQTCRDGRRIIVESRWTMQQVDAGQGSHILEINKDITFRKKAEAALRESQKQLQSYIDQAGDAIYVLDAESGRILNANARAEQMTGYNHDELLRLSAADLEHMHSRAFIDDVHARARHGAVQVEGLHRRKDGSIFPVEIRLTLLAPSPPHRILSIVRDISERKQLEQERADEVRRKDEFLALLGHELRNPLAAIHTAVQVLSGGAASPAQRVRLEDIIARQTSTMRRLIDDLLDLERITHGHIELKLQNIDLTECLQSAIASIQSIVAARRQELVLELPTESVHFMADGTRLDQILGNLLTNASKYTAPGGRIELAAATDGVDVIIRCKDNGQGILPENQQTIFQAFARGRKTELGYGEASIGIGLALVKQLTELHGGTISAESAGAGRGSMFTVRLPLVTPPSVPTLTQERISVSQHPQSVVIVEDNPNVGEVLKVALEQAGHTVQMFADGPSTLTGVSLLRPDAFLIDISLPGMNGYELAAKLKQEANTKDALLIAVSGMTREQHAGCADRFDHYFRKPVEVSEVLSLLEQISFKEVHPPK